MKYYYFKVLCARCLASQKCGGTFNLTSGALNKTVDVLDKTFDGDCRWTIQAPRENTIELKLMTINISDDTACSSDYLKV